MLLALFLGALLVSGYSLVRKCLNNDNNEVLVIHLKPIFRFFPACLFVVGSPVFALQALDDEGLADVTGQDGITLTFENSGAITADEINLTLDPGDLTYENTLTMEGVSLQAIGADGGTTTDPLSVSLALDAYVHPSSGNAAAAADITWGRTRFQTDRLYMSDDVTANFGEMAIDASGRFYVAGDNGLLSSGTNEAAFQLNIGDVDSSNADPSFWAPQDPAQIYYRQGAAGSPEIVLDNFGLLFDMHEGSIGIDSDGIVLSSSNRLDFNLTFDLAFDSAGASPFAYNAADDLPVLHFGWRGGWDDMYLRLRSGGVGPGPTYAQTSGFEAALAFNFENDYRVVVGESGGGTGAYIELTNPVSLPYSGVNGNVDGKDFQVGSIALDAISAGQGPGGICFGNDTNAVGASPLCGSVAATNPTALGQQFVNLAPEDNALAIVARDWKIRAYSSKILYHNPAPMATDPYLDEGWALIYTVGELDGNVYLYPQTGGGVNLDAFVAIQTFGTTDQERWENGTHFMIGDTDKNLAIGIVGGDLLLGLDDASLNMVASGVELSTTNKARLQVRGMLGGGDIPNLSTFQRIAYADLNLESDHLVFRLTPAPAGESYLGYSGFVSIVNLDEANFSNDTSVHGDDDGSYLSLAEPGFDRLDVDFRIADVTGDVEVQNGKVDLRTAAETSHGRPELRVSNTVLLGQLATVPGSGAAGDIARINRVEFGGNSLGSIVIPGAQINSAMTFKQQY